MASEGLRKRLEELNRRPLAVPPSDEAERKRGRWADAELPKEAKSQGETQPTGFTFPPDLRDPYPKESRVDNGAGAIPNAIEHTPEIGRSCLCVVTRIADVEPQCESYAAEFVRLFPPFASRVGQHCCVPHATAPRTVFLDIETSGLGSSPVFLVGLLGYEDGALVARQYLARNYSEEATILLATANTLRETHLLVTFNGRQFDVPLLETRSAAHGLRWYETDGHLDLLIVARMGLRGRVPNCKLKTLERVFCGRSRDSDDIPGAQIPKVYDRYARTGDTSQITRILKHNLFDLVTMAPLMARLFAGPYG